MAMAMYVLVHGAGRGGWCWKKVTPLLRSQGHEVYTPTLTGLGERAHLVHLGIDRITLSTHIEDVVNVLTFEDLTGVILVGHSYGGMVTTGVAERVPERLAHLVYLDCIVPQDGQARVNSPEDRAQWEQRAREQERRLQQDPASWGPVRASNTRGVTDEADIRWMQERVMPHPARTVLEPVRVSHPLAACLPRTYIRCTRERQAGYDASAARLRADFGCRYRELDSVHDAMVSAPRELADLLLEVASVG